MSAETSVGTASEREDEDGLRRAVHGYLARYVDEPASLEQENLLTGGVLDSLAAAGLISFLERRFGVVVADDDLEIENFDSLDAITAFVRSKL
ncbi:acyl carrier protein [Cellulosimicrobium cellulans]|jgi:acyl carrier protein|uniref:Carrier domain-containing protein n=1 Tax=Cellulosimicrobium cellulans TaxID=1710 RepID=A0A4Y4DZE0_CELCE|nr:acyl carrier protein [Cellulosimicrobium cellulans]UKJ62326.1 acyl carrier protein [Cellulosimicrobium cellulans]GED10742.1 hypothetical protein CCE02nite_27410 [Cellulosimicrobium cellulans]